METCFLAGQHGVESPQARYDANNGEDERSLTAYVNRLIQSLIPGRFAFPSKSIYLMEGVSILVRDETAIQLVQISTRMSQVVGKRHPRVGYRVTLDAHRKDTGAPQQPRTEEERSRANAAELELARWEEILAANDGTESGRGLAMFDVYAAFSDAASANPWEWTASHLQDVHHDLRTVRAFYERFSTSRHGHLLKS